MCIRDRLIDYMLDEPFQNAIPENMFVFPANTNAEVPQSFVDHAVVADDPIVLDPAYVEANLNDWTEQWTETVLR